MRHGFIGSTVAGAMLAAAVAHGQGYDVSARFALDPDSSDDSPLTTVVSGGCRLSDVTTLGLYGSFQTADRKLPANMEYILGAGVYGEFGPDAPDLLLLPYAGASVGFLDPSGVGWQTMVHLQGSLGARFPLQSGWMLTTSVALHWTDEEFFDAEADRRGNVSADDTDVTFDVGVLRRFSLPAGNLPGHDAAGLSGRGDLPCSADRAGRCRSVRADKRARRADAG